MDRIYIQLEGENPPTSHYRPHDGLFLPGSSCSDRAPDELASHYDVRQKLTISLQLSLLTHE